MSHFRDAYPLDYTLSRPPTPSILRRTAVFVARIHWDIRVPRFTIHPSVFLLDLSFDVIIIPWDRREKEKESVVILSYKEKNVVTMDKNFRTICRKRR